MDFITYNKPEDSERRSKVKEMTFEEEKQVAVLINKMYGICKSEGSWLPNEEQKNLIQKFIDNYQNLNHHKVTTCGLLATDRPDIIKNSNLSSDEKGLFFEIKY
jgi:hypothetical protein